MNIAEVQSSINSKVDPLTKFANLHPYPLLFATISGAHLYGFPSEDSDFDLRGVHCVELGQAIGLKDYEETVNQITEFQGMEMDLVTHEVKKFMGLMLKKNGYVLEQLLSPLVVKTTSWHQQLVDLASDVITNNHAYHYLGFAANQWKLFQKESEKRVKPLLYCFRVLLTGIHLMKTGELEANLSHLNQHFRLSFLDELMDAKIHGPEKCLLEDPENPFYEREFQRLESCLQQAQQESKLPDVPKIDRLNELLIQIRTSQ